MPLYDLTEFLKLSSVLNYNLSASSLNRYNILSFIIGDRRLHANDAKDRENKGFVMEALSFIFDAYIQKRRRLGPMAVLHPIRATALLSRSVGKMDVVQVLTALFHDVLEDIKPVDFAPGKWKELEMQIFNLLGRIDPEDEEKLIGNLECLTRVGGESYYHYIGRLLDCSCGRYEVMRTKLADRLDNTLDMRIEIQDPLEGIDFFKNIFQLMFVNNYRGFETETHHSPSTTLNASRRLYQLFKNSVLMSLIRQRLPNLCDQDDQILFDALAEASLREAQRTLINLMGHHYKNVAHQRPLLLEAMGYCYGGGSEIVTRPDEKHPMDGLFSTYFGHESKQVRNQKLDLLYRDKPLMIQASIAFISMFLSFMNDSTFYVKGITAEGMKPS